MREPEWAAPLAGMPAACSTASPWAADFELREATPALPARPWGAGRLLQAETKGGVVGPIAAACRWAMGGPRQRSRRCPTLARSRLAFPPMEVGRAPCAPRNTVQVYQSANGRRGRVRLRRGHRAPYSNVAVRGRAGALCRAKRGSPERWPRLKPTARAYHRSQRQSGERTTEGTRRGSSQSRS